MTETTTEDIERELRRGERRAIACQIAREQAIRRIDPHVGWRSCSYCVVMLALSAIESA